MKRWIALLLCLLLVPGCALGEEMGFRFDLRFAMEAAGDPTAAALGELLDMLQVQGTYALQGDSFDLDGSFLLDGDEETRTGLRLYGLPHRWYLRSPLLGNETAMLDMVAALEFGIKIDAHLALSLQNLFLLLPYSHQSAFAAMREAAYPVLYARETTRSVTKKQLLTLCDTLLSLSQTDRAFTYWLQSVAGLSEHPEQVTSSIRANLAGMRDWLSARMDSSMSITVKNNQETWKLRKITVFQRTWDESGEHAHISLPKLPDGSSWEIDWQWTRDGDTASLLITADATREDGSTLMALRVNGNGLPVALPVNAPFTLTCEAAYAAEAPRTVTLTGEGWDGDVTVRLTVSDGTRVRMEGTLLPWAPEVWPQWEDVIDDTWNIFSLYEHSLSDFVDAIARPMLTGAMPLLARAPVNVCVTLMDLATQAGLFQILQEPGAEAY